MSFLEDFKKYVGVFPKKNVDRFTMSCPDCGTGRNTAACGGNDRCFHCDSCGLIECVVTSPVIEEEDSINENGKDQ